MPIFKKMMEGKTLLICWLILVAVMFLIFLIPALIRGDQADCVSIIGTFSIIEGIILLIGIIGMNMNRIATAIGEFYGQHPMVVYGILIFILIISIFFTGIVPYPINIFYLILDIIMVIILLVIVPVKYSLIMILIGIVTLFIFLIITEAFYIEGYIGIVVVSTLIALMIVWVGYAKRKEWREKEGITENKWS